MIRRRVDWAGSLRRLVVPMLLLTFSVGMGISSTGFFEPDELTHFLKAREMLHDWREVLDIWGRPACTGLYGLAAAVGGLIGARMLAVMVTGLVGWGSVSLYRLLRRARNEENENGYFVCGGEAWVWVLLYAQPLFLMNSFTVMTEMLLACAWVWALVLLLRGRVGWAGFVLGLGGLARPEGWLAIASWPVFLWMWRCVKRGDLKWGEMIRSIGWSMIPMAGWWLAGVVAYGNWRWMIDYFPWQARSQYGTTGILFIVSSVAALALWMWVPVFVGAAALWKRREWRGVLFLVLPSGAFFLLHGVLGSLGLMGAMSLPRYFVCVSPMLAVLGVRGLQSLAGWMKRPRLLRKAVIFAVMMPGFLLVSLGQLPVGKSGEMQQLDVVIAAFEQRVPQGEWSERLIAEEPYVYYRLGVAMDTPLHDRIFNREAMRTAPAGTYVITDTRLWGWERRPTEEDLAAWGYQLLVVPEERAASFDMSMIEPRVEDEMRVGLWAKEK